MLVDKATFFMWRVCPGKHQVETRFFRLCHDFRRQPSLKMNEPIWQACARRRDFGTPNGCFVGFDQQLWTKTWSQVSTGCCEWDESDVHRLKRSFPSVMGSVTSALTRTRNALVKVGSEPENNESDRTRSALESDRAKKKSARFNASSQTGRQSSRASLSEVLSRPDSGGGRQSSKKKTSEGQQSGNSNYSVLSVWKHVIVIITPVAASNWLCLSRTHMQSSLLFCTSVIYLKCKS